MDPNQLSSKIAIGASFLATFHQKTATFFEIHPNLQNKPDSCQYSYKNNDTPNHLSFTGYTCSKAYNHSIKTLMINDGFAMCFFDNHTVCLHPLNRDYFLEGAEAVMTFPSDLSQVGGAIATAYLSNYFLILANFAGTVTYYSLEDFTPIQTFTHQEKIINIYHQTLNSTKLIFVDELFNAFVYCPTTDRKLQITWSKSNSGALWESGSAGNKNTYVTWANSIITTHVYISYGLKGQKCYPLDNMETNLPYGFKPLIFYNGSLVCQVFIFINSCRTSVGN